ncbi:hypothetical protein PT2222_320039 [Paraburkholderia tropica]
MSATSACRAGISGLRALRGHRLAQAQRTHVGPYGLDVREALVARTGLALRAPALGHGLVCRPDRILLFVIQHDMENGVLVAPAHCSPPWFEAMVRIDLGVNVEALIDVVLEVDARRIVALAFINKCKRKR